MILLIVSAIEMYVKKVFSVFVIVLSLSSNAQMHFHIREPSKAEIRQVQNEISPNLYVSSNHLQACT